MEWSIAHNIWDCTPALPPPPRSCSILLVPRKKYPFSTRCPWGIRLPADSPLHEGLYPKARFALLSSERMASVQPAYGYRIHILSGNKYAPEVHIAARTAFASFAFSLLQFESVFARLSAPIRCGYDTPPIHIAYDRVKDGLTDAWPQTIQKRYRY